MRFAVSTARAEIASATLAQRVGKKLYPFTAMAKTMAVEKSAPQSSDLACDFPAIDLPPEREFEAIHRFYRLLEPDIVAAIQRGDRREARRLINHVLVHIYSLEDEPSDFLKGLLLEFVVVLSRRAIQSGAHETKLMGFGFQCLQQLASIHEDEGLSAWLRETMEFLFDVFPRTVQSKECVERAMRHIRTHLSEELDRETVATAAGVSPGHLSELLKTSTGRSFQTLLRDLRVQQACVMLSQGDRSLSDIAAACGFYDQSHFTKVFRECRGLTPRQYRCSAENSHAHP